MVSGTAYLYAHSAGWATWYNYWHYPGPNNGSMFLTSQKGYLRGIDCNAAEVHFLCQERFDEDWRALLRTFGVRSTSPFNGSWHSHDRSAGLDTKFESNVALTWRMKRLKRAHDHAVAARANSFLSDDDKEFIRRELYPWDTALHDWVCKGDRSPRAQSAKTS